MDVTDHVSRFGIRFATDVAEVARSSPTRAVPDGQRDRAASVTIFQTKRCPAEQGISLARKYSSWLNNMRDCSESKYRIMVVCCTSNADPVRLEDLYGVDGDPDDLDQVNRLEIDEWLFRAESALSSWPILDGLYSLDVHTHELKPCVGSTTFVLISFDCDMHGIAQEKLRCWLSRFSHPLLLEDSTTIPPLLDMAKEIVERNTESYRTGANPLLREVLVQWKLQWLKSYYVTLVTKGEIDVRYAGKWICLGFSSGMNPWWNGRYFDDECDAVDSCIDDKTNIQAAPCVHLEVQIGGRFSFKLKTFEFPVQFYDILCLPTIQFPINARVKRQGNHDVHQQHFMPMISTSMLDCTCTPLG